ncbi:uncharacterized protein TM35_000301540 [Trypanosoma theileri]|uniref:Uncharacterized protein n=1 Tax=Trypanosoma theileri TaxID=67003 RepID=A0A1X0NN34_9TRYP|nr:uncharacterized protein TM35_000301540 [Trypanosoma theileri]ORC86114.1 hypothetical protein TM35_000301540 [Trypanosoma theileri]
MQQDEEDEEEEVRVFVNNQNTRSATVTIPKLTKRRQTRIGDGFKHSGRNFGGLAMAGQSSSAADDGNKNSSSTEKKNTRATASIVQGDIHPHLEDVYQRVMRRLQRRANYEEVRCPSLAVQFGIVDAADDEKSRERSDWDLDDHHTSLVSTSSSTTAGKSSFPRRRHPQPHTHSGKETSRGLTNTRSTVDPLDDTGFLSQQPCPQTLRLVLEQVTGIVADKLRMADVGSLKDCLRLVFESRAMLDRLLKEIPSYSQFQGDVERLPTAIQLHEIYQEFRQKPIVLPSASYVRDPVSGRVVATVGEVGDDAYSSTPTRRSNEMKQPQPLEQQQEEEEEERKEEEKEKDHDKERRSTISPGTPSSPPMPLANTPTPGERSPPNSLSHVKKVALPSGISLTIPANYAKSSRTRQNTGRPSHGNKSTSGHPSRLTSAHGERAEDGRHSSMKEKRTDTSPSRPGTAGSASASAPSTSVSVANTVANVNTVGTSSSTTRLGGNGNTPALMQTIPPTERWRQATQQVSAGVLTDINSSTVVSREEYEELIAYSKKLEVDIEEQKREIKELTKELNEEKAYTSQKKKVVQYLRETLYKECSVLRAQLSTAQQKQIQYQALLKEQQQQQVMAYAASLEGRGGGGGGGGGGANASVYEHSRLPTIGSTRTQGNETSVMMMSVSPGLFSVRRANPNVSVFSVARQSLNTDDHNNETSHSVIGGTSICLGSAAPNPVVQQQQQQISIDIGAIQSLLDLVLLAVEKDQMLPGNVSKAKHANMNIIASAMEDDPHLREQKLREEFAERHQQIKQSYTLNRVQTTNMLAAKDEQIKYLKKSSDLHFLRRYWQEKGELLRSELRRLRYGVLDELDNLKHFVVTTMESIANRARVVDTTLRDNHSLYSTQSALRDIISSARSLLLPMMTTEYVRGYHPWPLKLRNTMDPFSHMVKARYGDGQLLMIRDELNSLSDIYVMLHHYVMKSDKILQMKRPMTGKTLEQLCSAIVLNGAATAEIWIQVREKYVREREFQKKIAKLNVSLIALLYQQRILAERSTEAIREAGMDPRLISLPAQRTINKIAENVHKVVTERAQLRKQRQDNARDVYRIWKTKQIDVNEGYPPPTNQQRVVLGEVDVFRQGSMVALPLSGSIRIRTGTDSLVRTSIIQGQAKSFWERMLSTSVEDRSLIEQVENTPSETAGSSVTPSINGVADS